MSNDYTGENPPILLGSLMSRFSRKIITHTAVEPVSIATENIRNFNPDSDLLPSFTGPVLVNAAASRIKSLTNPRRFVDRIEQLEAQGIAVVMSELNQDINGNRRTEIEKREALGAKDMDTENIQSPNRGTYSKNTQGIQGEDVAPFNVDGIIDSILDPSDKSNSTIRGKELLINVFGTNNKKLDFKKLYIKNRAAGSKMNGVYINNMPGPGEDNQLKYASFANGLIPMGFKGENEQSVVESDFNKSPSEILSDDVAYIPLSFTDLRPIYGNKLRTVYFRPIITSLIEDFSPEWSKTNYYGRVDPVATYQSTVRTISLSFEIHVFFPEDIVIVARKLNWLNSLVYPEYDKDLILKSGPIARLRVGDIISRGSIKGAKVGLSGIIESLSYDYSDALWELKKNFKVPRSINVSLQFTVLHDTLIGRGSDGKFGGIGSVDSNGIFSPFKEGAQLETTNKISSTDAFRGIGEVNRNKDPRSS